MVSMVGTAGLVLVTTPVSRPRISRGHRPGEGQSGKYNFGTSGVGTTQHFSAELMSQLAGLDMQHVPYRPTPAGHGLTRARCSSSSSWSRRCRRRYNRAMLRAIAVTSPQRFPAVPDIPTFEEGGPAGFDVTSWYGLSFPAGTPTRDRGADQHGATRPARDRGGANADLKVGALVRSSTPDELKAHIADEITKWKAVREKANIEQQ